jgi:hypothetical protein
MVFARWPRGILSVASAFAQNSLSRAGIGGVSFGEGGFGCKALVLRWMGKSFRAVTGEVENGQFGGSGYSSV